MEGCYHHGAAFVWADGRAAPVRSKASNRCPGCARAVAFENLTMLRQDAEGGRPPTHVLTLTSRDPVTDAGAYRSACAVFWRAFRRRWGRSIEYCGFVEWTTGDGPRSGGHRRMHSHWLLKGVREEADLAAIEEWCSIEWRKLTGAWVVQLAELRHAGGVVGYLALHHEKLSQAPPPGWSGRRLRPSRGYFSEDGRTRRERAQQWLREHRWKAAGMDDGAMLNESLRAAPRLVWGLSEWQKQAREVVAAPSNRFRRALAFERENEARLLRAAEQRAREDEVERYERLFHETLYEAALRSRALRRREKPAGASPG